MAETDTPVAPSPVESPPLGPTAEAPPQAPPASTPEVPAAPSVPEAPPEGGPESAAGPEFPEQPWRTIESRDALLEHSVVSEHVAEREQAAAKQARSDVQARVQGFVQKREHHMATIEAGVNEMLKDFKRLQRDNVADPQALSNLLDDHEGTLSGVGGIQRQMGVWEGVAGMVVMVANAVGNPDLETEFRMRAQAMGNGMPDNEFYKDFAAALGDAHAKEVLERERPKIEKQTRERIELEARQTQRVGQPSAVGVAGTGVGGGKRYLDMTAEERAALTPAERDEVIRRG